MEHDAHWCGIAVIFAGSGCAQRGVASTELVLDASWLKMDTVWRSARGVRAAFAKITMRNTHAHVETQPCTTCSDRMSKHLGSPP
eukprot:1684082-Rhodomonas_salina.1